MANRDKWDDLVSSIRENKRCESPLHMDICRPEHMGICERIEFLASQGITPIIGEIKPRSPSGGILRKNPDIAAIVKYMVDVDVAGISVLTEDLHFGGSKEMFADVALQANVPLLMKDFLTEKREIEEADRLGADMVLLIARLLGDDLEVLFETAMDLGITPLVEVHDEYEVEQAIVLEPEIVGINNRNLRNFSIDLGVTRNLAGMFPDNILIVSESGYMNRSEVEEMEGLCDAFLIGSALMKGNVGRRILELQGRAAS